MSTQTETGIDTRFFFDGIITSDTDQGMALAQAIDAGIVHVDDQPVSDEPQMPFGGTAVVDEFTETRWITVQRGSHPFPF